MRHAPPRCTLPSLCPNRTDPGRCPVTLALSRTPALYPAAPAAARRTLLDVLAETAAVHPHEAAIDAGGRVLTYRRLAEEVDAVRRRLAEAGIGIGDRVGVRVSSGTAELYVAILAVLAAGAAYVPVDADDPEERAELVFGEAGVCAVLGDDGSPDTAQRADRHAAAHRATTTTRGSSSRPARPAPRRASRSRHRLRRGVRRRRGARCSSPTSRIGPGDRVLAGLSVAFDASCEEMWLAWRHGACLVPGASGRWCAPGSTSGRGWWRSGSRSSPPSRRSPRCGRPDALEDVRLLIFGGEACPPELAERVAVEGREVWNTYGPTEATVVACAAQLDRRRTGPDRAAARRLGSSPSSTARASRSRWASTGELVIGGVGLARYLDTDKDADEVRPAALAGLGARLPQRRRRPRRPETGCCSSGAPTNRSSSAAGASSWARSTPRCRRCPASAVRRRPCARTRAGNQVLVGYVVPENQPGGELDTDAAALALREQLPGRARAAARGRRRPADANVGQGRPGRAAVAAASTLQAATARPRRGGPADPHGGLAGRGAGAEILGVPVDRPEGRLLPHGGGSLTAAQLVARIRTRYPQVSVVDVYQHPKLGALAARARRVRARPRPGRATSCRRRDGRRSPGAAHGAAADARRLALDERRRGDLDGRGRRGPLGAAPCPWWWLAAAWLVLFSPAGRIGIAAGGARLLLRGVRPGSYPRGGSVHLRLWVGRAPRRASGATGDLRRRVDHLLRPCARREDRPGRRPALRAAGHRPAQDRRRRGRRARGRPRRLLGRRRRRAHRQDPDRRRRRRRRAQHAAARARGSARAPRSRRGRRCAAPSPQASAGPARPRARSGESRRATGRRPRPPRSRRWALAYGVTSMLLGAAPRGRGAACAGDRRGRASQATASAADATRAALLMVARCDARVPARRTRRSSWQSCACSASACAEGFHPVHSRAGWQVWTTERLMDMARTGLFPLYSSLFTPVWLRLLGAEVGRDVEASTVLALPKMTTIADGAFLADDTMVGDLRALRRLDARRAVTRRQAGVPRQLRDGRAGPSVPNRGLVGVLSAAPRKVEEGFVVARHRRRCRCAGRSSRATTSRTFHPPRRLQVARAADRAVPGRAGDVLRRARSCSSAGSWWRSRPPMGSRWPRCSPARCCSPPASRPRA